MDVVTDPANFVAPIAGTAVTIGAYDGVHRGHQFVIDQLRRLAGAGGLDSVVLTFDRHPAAVVRPESAPKLLTDLDQKLELLGTTGVDHAVVVHFDQARSQEEPEDFIREVLVGSLGARIVVVGEDFHFGRRRRGNVELLAEMGGALGFEVMHVPLLAGVSSTQGRRLLEAGDGGGGGGAVGGAPEGGGARGRGGHGGGGGGGPTGDGAPPGGHP